MGRLEVASTSGGSRITGRTSGAAIANGTETTRLRQCRLPHGGALLRSNPGAIWGAQTSSAIMWLLNNNRGRAVLRRSPGATSAARRSRVFQLRPHRSRRASPLPGRWNSVALLLNRTMKVASVVAARLGGTGASRPLPQGALTPRSVDSRAEAAYTHVIE
jgi:hypothetical protein